MYVFTKAIILLQFIIYNVYSDIYHEEWWSFCKMFQWGCKDPRWSMSKLYLKDNFRALRSIFSFSWKYRNYIDATFYTGLFFAQVQLKNALGDATLFKLVPNAVRIEISELMTMNLKNLDYYIYKSCSEENKTATNIKKIMASMENVPTYCNPYTNYSRRWLLAEFNYSTEHYEKIKSTFLTAKPTPEKVEKCLLEIIRKNFARPYLYPEYFEYCRFDKNDEECYHLLDKITPYGFGLARSLFIATFARTGRKCMTLAFHVNEEDARILQMCKMVFHEAFIMARHDFPYLGLLFQQITLCALNGFADYFNEDWWNVFLKKLSPIGCFSSPHTKKTRAILGAWRISRQEFNILNNTCSIYATGFGASAFASIIRYLVRKTY